MKTKQFGDDNISIFEENMPVQHIAYMRRIGAYGKENQSLMETFKTWIKENNLFRDEAVILGIAWDDSQAVNPDNCRYDVCLIVAEDFYCEDVNIMNGKLSGGKYVVMRIPHTAEALQNAWSNGLGYLAQAYTFDFSRPIIERYAKVLVDNHLCELCVPII